MAKSKSKNRATKATKTAKATRGAKTTAPSRERAPRTTPPFPVATDEQTAATEQTAFPARADATGEFDTGAASDAAEQVDDVPATAASQTRPAGESRLPKVGTVLEKRDRHGTFRCKCTVEAGGIRYNRKLYRSLSGAAMAAAQDLGLKNKTQNGYVFWGVTKPPRAAANRQEAANRAWDRYNGHVNALVEAGAKAGDRAAVLAMLREHEQAIKALRDQVE